jgi:hypothetical protein
MSPEQRARFVDTYLAYLRERDGVPDLASRSFDRRERLFAAIDAAPIRWEGPPPVSQAVFDRNHAAATPEPDLDEATLWALATAKTNRAERFGVDLSITHDRKTRDQQLQDPHTWVQIEEVYHTRILRDVLHAIGLTVEVSSPNPTTQLLIRAMVHLPTAVSDVLVLCGEIVGVTIFALLLERARALFAGHPALPRIEALFAQILVDEVGHVQFLRARCGPVRLALARRLIATVAGNVVDDIPELDRLFGRDTIIARAQAARVDEDAAPYPDRLRYQAA